MDALMSKYSAHRTLPHWTFGSSWLKEQLYLWDDLQHRERHFEITNFTVLRTLSIGLFLASVAELSLNLLLDGGNATIQLLRNLKYFRPQMLCVRPNLKVCFWQVVQLERKYFAFTHHALSRFGTFNIAGLYDPKAFAQRSLSPPEIALHNILKNLILEGKQSDFTTIGTEFCQYPLSNSRAAEAILKAALTAPTEERKAALFLNFCEFAAQQKTHLELPDQLLKGFQEALAKSALSVVYLAQISAKLKWEEPTEAAKFLWERALALSPPFSAEEASAFIQAQRDLAGYDSDFITGFKDVINSLDKAPSNLAPLLQALDYQTDNASGLEIFETAQALGIKGEPLVNVAKLCVRLANTYATCAPTAEQLPALLAVAPPTPADNAVS